jgi:hypothetical protein
MARKPPPLDPAQILRHPGALRHLRGEERAKAVILDAQRQRMEAAARRAEDERAARAKAAAKPVEPDPVAPLMPPKKPGKGKGGRPKERYWPIVEEMVDDYLMRGRPESLPSFFESVRERCHKEVRTPPTIPVDRTIERCVKDRDPTRRN